MGSGASRNIAETGRGGDADSFVDFADVGSGKFTRKRRGIFHDSHCSEGLERRIDERMKALPESAMDAETLEIVSGKQNIE